jgi:outer membrane receptor protein involved in Fe transport
MVNFIAADTKEIREFEQFRVAGNITGDIIELPAGPVAVAVGAEYRKDIGRIIVDDLQRSGNIYGFNATQDQNGSIDVREVYGEVRIPVLADKPFMQELSIEAGGRYSDYSTIGKLSNWKAGANYAPFTWLKFRGIFNKAARAPSVVELFQNGDQGFPSLTDPCNATPARTAATRTICLQQGVPTSGIDSFAAANSQVQAFSFGDANLQEEKAETYTLGAVITPNLPIGRGSLTVDYFNIKIDNVISALGSSYYIRGCYVSGRADDCAKVIRNRSTGQIESVNTGIANQDALKTSGIDVGLNWSFDLSEIAGSLPGSLSFNEQFSWLDSYSINGTEYASTSSGGIGSAFPEFKSTLSVAYRLSDFTAQLRWNYSASVEEDWDETPNPQTPALSTFDLSLRQVVAKSFEVTAIVQNLFEQKPVRTPNGYFDQGGVDTAWYNNIILGRTFTISGKVRF